MTNKLRCLLIISLMYIWSCRSENTNISVEIEDFFKSSKKEVVDFKLSDLIKDKFDSYIILPPYTYIKRVEKRIKIDLHELEKIGIESRDDINILCLIKNDRLIHHYEVSRQSIIFSGLPNINLIENRTNLRLIKQKGIYYISRP